MQVSANQLHYSEEFESGDRCVKTGTRRSASVRYFCQLKENLRDEYATPRRRVARMTEVRTCVYEIDVVVPGLCAHTAFKVGVVNALNEFPPSPLSWHPFATPCLTYTPASREPHQPVLARRRKSSEPTPSLTSAASRPSPWRCQHSLLPLDWYPACNCWRALKSSLIEFTHSKESNFQS